MKYLLDTNVLDGIKHLSSNAAQKSAFLLIQE